MVWANRPVNWAPGRSSVGLDTEAILDGIDLLMNPPRARLVQSVAQTLTTGVFAGLTFDTEAYDTYDGHSTAANTNRYTAKLPGYYLFTGKAAYAASSAGFRAVAWAFNGTIVDGAQLSAAVTASATAIEVVALPLEIPMNGITDWVELQAYQNSGGNLNTDVSFNTILSMMSVRWTGPL